MKLKGILDFSLGNFLCLRGFAPMGVLQDISAPPLDIQRVPKDERLKEVGDYLRKGELVFFPEIILCAYLSEEEVTSNLAADFFEKVKAGLPFRSGRFAQGVAIDTAVSRSRGADDIRAVKFFQTATLSHKGILKEPFARLDGNHRLTASKDQLVRDRVTPFCLILCQNQVDFRRFSRSLFHNINYKQVPITMEHNLRLILEDVDLFADEILKKPTDGFGWPYYLTRKLHGSLDLDLLPNLAVFFKSEPRARLLSLLKFLIDWKALGENDNAKKRLSVALGQVNGLFENHPALKASDNFGLLIALTYFQLEARVPVISFVRWVVANHLHEIAESNPADLVAIFEKILLSRKRTIFVSMPFGRDVTENHYTEIENVVAGINRDYPDFKPQLRVQRVDFLEDGTSFPIRAKIDEFMDKCGLLIANLTYCNPNVYHEVGFMDGKAKASNVKADVLLFLDESVASEDRKVGFNLNGSKQIRFTRNADFAKKLRYNIESHFGLVSQPEFAK
jgi:hypothetical protein